MSVNLKGRSFLTLSDFTPDEITYLLDLSADLKAKKRGGVKGAALAGKNVALLFEKASTRTRCAFTVACVDEGGHPEFLGKNDIHLGGKEDVRDTARVLGRMFDGIEFRGFKQSMVEELAKWAGVPVWNGLTDVDHPTQVLADLLTLQENFGKQLKGLSMTYLGDGRNNMANALMIGCAKMGVNFVIGSPKDLFPNTALVDKCKADADKSGAEIRVVDDPKAAVKGADAIYTDVWVSMGQEAEATARMDAFAGYRVTDRLMAQAARGAIFLHCLPAHRGLEVDASVIDGPASAVWQQAENRMHAARGLFLWLAGQPR